MYDDALGREGMKHLMKCIHLNAFGHLDRVMSEAKPLGRSPGFMDFTPFAKGKVGHVGSKWQTRVTLIES